MILDKKLSAIRDIIIEKEKICYHKIIKKINI